MHELATEKLPYEEIVVKRLSIGRENQIFHIEVILPNLRHPQLSIKDEVLKLKDGIFFANLQTILPFCFIFTKRYSCTRRVNYAKKHERQGDVKCR